MSLFDKWRRQDKKRFDPDSLSKYTVQNDRWDREDQEKLLANLPEFDAERDRFCDTVDTGNSMWADALWLLNKVEPQPVPTREIRPSYLVDAVVRDEMTAMPQYRELRELGTVGDDVASALGVIAMREKLEESFDRLAQERELAKQFEEQALARQELLDEQHAIETLMDDLRETINVHVEYVDSSGPQPPPPPGPPEPLTEGQTIHVDPNAPPSDDKPDPNGQRLNPDKPLPATGGKQQARARAQGNQQPAERELDDAELDDAKAQLDQLGEQQRANATQLEELADALEDTTKALEKGIERHLPEVRKHLKEGLTKAVDEAEALQDMYRTWGTEPGQLQRLPAAERMKLAERLIKGNQRLRRIAELFGPMKRLAFTEQRRRTNHARDEIYDVEIGDDLDMLVSDELVNLVHPGLRLDFYRRFLDGELLQYKTRGDEVVGKGAIIYLEDGSGSMKGDRELWAKAVGLCLLHIAHEQKRAFKVIHFGSAHQTHEIDFSRGEDWSIEKILEFAEIFFNGGTDYVTPMNLALKHLQGEFQSDGRVKADIVIATDDECRVPDEWLRQYKVEQEKLGFAVWGIAIGAARRTTTLDALCDGRVAQVEDLVGGSDIRGVFGGV